MLFTSAAKLFSFSGYSSFCISDFPSCPQIMKRPRRRNQFLREKTEDTRKLYVKQRNKCVSLLKKAKKYYQNSEEKNVIDNKKFWKTIKTYQYPEKK